MTKILLAAGLFLLTVSSCDLSRSKGEAAEVTPQALKENSNSYSLVSKRGADDMVESLYQELAKKNSSLKELELQIQKLEESKEDSLASFSTYDSKNQAYYQSATNKIGEIQDTLLQQRMKNLIAGSLTNYETTISKHNAILNLIGKNQLTLTDLHILLKIVNTLPLIEKYQKENIPSVKSLKGYSDALTTGVKYADSLTRK